MPKPRKGTITVPLGEDLLARVNTVAKARQQSTAEFVRELLKERTRKHQKLVGEIIEREEKIMKREQAEAG